jgi:AraC family transcriptional regulator
LESHVAIGRFAQHWSGRVGSSAVRIVRPPEAGPVIIPGFEVVAGTHAAGSALAPHAHDDPTLCYVLHGRFTEHLRGRVLDCGTDTLKLTAAGRTHSNRFPHTETRGLRIDIARARFGESPAIQRFLDGEAFLPRSGARPVFRRLAAELSSRDDAAPLVIEGLLLELLARLAREHAAGAAHELPPWLRRADELIHDAFASPLTLRHVAREVGVSASTLARAYRARYGTSVGERVRRLRVEWAAGELEHSGAPVSGIALRAGFYDQAHFSNVFRRVFGVTPARYRSLARQR